MPNIGVQENVGNVILLISRLLLLPIATVVVAHSPTPSAVRIIALSKGDG